MQMSDGQKRSHSHRNNDNNNDDGGGSEHGSTGLQYEVP